MQQQEIYQENWWLKEIQNPGLMPADQSSSSERQKSCNKGQCQEVLCGSTIEHAFLYRGENPYFTHSPSQESSVDQSIVCMPSAAQLEKPFAVGGGYFKEQSLPRRSGNANLLMNNTDTRHAKKLFHSSRQELTSASFSYFLSECKSIFNYSTIKLPVLVPLLCTSEHCFCGLHVFNYLAWS